MTEAVQLLPITDDVKTNMTNHLIKIQDAKLEAEIEDQQWKSCCFNLHKSSTLFFGKLSISLVIISLCGYQLIRDSNPSSQALYSSILSSVMTFWLSKKVDS